MRHAKQLHHLQLAAQHLVLPRMKGHPSIQNLLRVAETYIDEASAILLGDEVLAKYAEWQRNVTLAEMATAQEAARADS